MSDIIIAGIIVGILGLIYFLLKSGIMGDYNPLDLRPKYLHDMFLGQESRIVSGPEFSSGRYIFYLEGNPDQPYPVPADEIVNGNMLYPDDKLGKRNYYYVPRHANRNEIFQILGLENSGTLQRLRAQNVVLGEEMKKVSQGYYDRQKGTYKVMGKNKKLFMAKDPEDLRKKQMM